MDIGPEAGGTNSAEYFFILNHGDKIKRNNEIQAGG